MPKDTAAPRQMVMVAFLQAQNCSNYPASWRHAETTQDFLTAEYYQRIARTLEAGRFHLAFFDDRLAMPDRYGDDYAEAVRHGIRVVKMDLIPLLTAMGLATRHLGVGGTYSTTYYEPFHVARVVLWVRQPAEVGGLGVVERRDHVPRGAPAHHVVERGEDARHVKRLVVRGRVGAADA